MYQLGSYVKFFQLLKDLEAEQLIDNKEKQLLKINFTTKDQQLMEILTQLETEDDEDIKYSLLNYLKSQNESKPQIQRQSKRTRSSITDITIKRFEMVQESKEVEQKQKEELDKACMVIQNYLAKHREGARLNDRVNQLIETLLANAPGVTSPQRQLSFNRSGSLIYDINIQLESILLDVYKRVKAQFTNHMRSHLLLMDENVSYNNIFALLKEMTKHLLDCDEFSFVVLQDSKAQCYSTTNDSNELRDLAPELQDRINELAENAVHQLDQESDLFKIFNVAGVSYCFRYNNTVFIYHQTKKDEEGLTNLLQIVNDYQLFEEIKELSQFLVQTVQNAKVQFFSPLSIADMILGIGISFVRCSKYLLIEEMFKQMQLFYRVEKFYAEQSDINLYDPEYAHIIFKDLQLTVIFKVQMNLNRQSDQRIYCDVKQYYEKYLRFIRECYDKNAFYKFFLRSNDSLIFEFNKSGDLIFLSRPIPQGIKEDFHIRFDSDLIMAGTLSYKMVFDPKIISDVDNYLQDQKWKVKKESQKYEVFIKIEEKTYKGFAVIFTENKKGWIQEQLKTLDSAHYTAKIHAKIRKHLIEQETMKFVDSLEANNPEVKNSVAALYMPLNQKHVKKRVSSTQHIHIQQDKPRTRMTELPLLQKHSFQELDLSSFQLEPGDDLVDTFEYNVLEVPDDIKKHRTVWAILKKIGAMENYQIAPDSLQNFIKEMEYHYNANGNPYHNYEHGITVMQSAHYLVLLIDKTKYSSLLDSFQKFVLMVSSFSHDVGHTGKTNLYEINSLSDLAIRYHDKSVLEQHHAALTIQILRNPSCNIIQNLSPEQFRNFRKGLIANILSTDMSEHFSLLKDFENRPAEFTDSKLLSGLILHLSDFGGIVKPTRISRTWSQRVNQEFIAQNRLEEQYGYPQQPYMKDLDKPHIMAKSEIGFLKVIVRPSYQLMSEFLGGGLQHCIQNIDESIQQWEKIAKKGESEHIQQ